MIKKDQSKGQLVGERASCYVDRITKHGAVHCPLSHDTVLLWRLHDYTNRQYDFKQEHAYLQTLWLEAKPI